MFHDEEINSKHDLKNEYFPAEALTGFQGEPRVYNQNYWIKLQRGGIFGHCEKDYPIKFMENLPIDECVLVNKPCTDLTFAKVAQISVFSGTDETDATIDPIVATPGD
jgi:hypothetical protein